MHIILQLSFSFYKSILELFSCLSMKIYPVFSKFYAEFPWYTIPYPSGGIPYTIYTISLWMDFRLFPIFIINDNKFYYKWIGFVVHILCTSLSIEINSLWKGWVKGFVHLKLIDSIIWPSRMAYKIYRSHQQWMWVHSYPYSHQQWILYLLNCQMKINLICISLTASEALHLYRCVLVCFMSCLIYELLLDSLCLFLLWCLS